MKPRPLLFFLLQTCLCCCLAAQNEQPIKLGTASTAVPVICEEEKLFEFSEPHLGTDFRLLFFSKNEATAKAAAADAFKRVEELDKIFSDYREDSEANLLSNSASTKKEIHVSDEMWEVLTYSLLVSRQSNDAFDVGMGALTKLWRRAFRQKEFPTKAAIKEARSTVGSKKIKMNPRKRTVRLCRAGMRLDFGGVAKGFIIDEALKTLNSHGIRSALVDGGGDLALSAPPPGKLGWAIEYQRPGKDSTETVTAYLSFCAVASSGSTYRFLEQDGKRYSHIIDPRTGMGITAQSIVTVFAPSCMEADAWATAVSVGVDEKTKKTLLDRGFLVIKTAELE